MAIERVTSTGQILMLVPKMTEPDSEPDAIQQQLMDTFSCAIDASKEEGARDVVIITLGNDIDVFCSNPSVMALVGMHRIFTDYVDDQVRENTT